MLFDTVEEAPSISCLSVYVQYMGAGKRDNCLERQASPAALTCQIHTQSEMYMIHDGQVPCMLASSWQGSKKTKGINPLTHSTF
jgi:hypothetical protein